MTFVEHSQNFVVLAILRAILRASPSILLVSGNVLRVFHECSNLLMSGNIVWFDVNAIWKQGGAWGDWWQVQNENYELVRKFENGQCFAIFFFFWLKKYIVQLLHKLLTEPSIPKIYIYIYTYSFSFLIEMNCVLYL